MRKNVQTYLQIYRKQKQCLKITQHSTPSVFYCLCRLKNTNICTSIVIRQTQSKLNAAIIFLNSISNHESWTTGRRQPALIAHNSAVLNIRYIYLFTAFIIRSIYHRPVIPAAIMQNLRLAKAVEWFN